MGNRLAACLLAFWMSVFGAGCNVFAFARPNESAPDHVTAGLRHLWDKEFAEAEADFTRALELDPLNAEARWGRAKARLLLTGLTSITLVAELSHLETDPAVGVRSALPFSDPVDWPIPRVNALYATMRTVVEDLGAIYDGGANSPELTPEAVALDYAASLSVLGVLTFRDTNLDLEVTEADLNLSPRFLTGGEFEYDDEQLPPESRENLVSAISGLLGKGSIIIIDLLSDAEGIDTEDLRNVIDQITAQL